MAKYGQNVVYSIEHTFFLGKKSIAGNPILSKKLYYFLTTTHPHIRQSILGLGKKYDPNLICNSWIHPYLWPYFFGIVLTRVPSVCCSRGLPASQLLAFNNYSPFKVRNAPDVQIKFLRIGSVLIEINKAKDLDQVVKINQFNIYTCDFHYTQIFKSLKRNNYGLNEIKDELIEQRVFNIITIIKNVREGKTRPMNEPINFIITFE